MDVGPTGVSVAVGGGVAVSVAVGGTVVAVDVEVGVGGSSVQKMTGGEGVTVGS